VECEGVEGGVESRDEEQSAEDGEEECGV